MWAWLYVSEHLCEPDYMSVSICVSPDYMLVGICVSPDYMSMGICAYEPD